MGDYGVGMRADAESSRRQRRIADVLERLVADHDIAFVLSLGDNIYQGEQGRVDQEGGGEDDDWYSSFFQPYRLAIARVPIFPTIGNHDSSDSEDSDDRAQMEDNFHIEERFHHGLETASVMPGLFYRLRYGAGLELACLDTSLDSEQEDIHRYFQAPKHQEWLRATFGRRPDRWLIPFSHHPVYTAGPDHENDEEMQEALEPLFDAAGVRLVLAGHEHNFQVSQVGESDLCRLRRRRTTRREGAGAVRRRSHDGLGGSGAPPAHRDRRARGTTDPDRRASRRRTAAPDDGADSRQRARGAAADDPERLSRHPTRLRAEPIAFDHGDGEASGRADAELSGVGPARRRRGADAARPGFVKRELAACRHGHR